MNTDDTTGTETAPAPVDERTSFAEFERELANPGDHAPATEQDADVTGENGTDDETGDAGDGKPKGKSVQERMNEITAARREAERVAEERAREVEYWKGMAEGKKAPADGDKPKAAEGEDPEPDPENYEYGEADGRFIADHARWNARDEFRKLREADAAQAQFAQLRSGHEARVADVAEKYPDYAEKVTASAQRGDWPCSQELAIGIMDSPVGPDVAYHLASNIDEAKRINALSTIDQARELGRLEAKFMNEPKEKTPEVKPPKAPPPPAHQARGAGGKFEVDDDTDDFAAFEAKYSGEKRR